MNERLIKILAKALELPEEKVNEYSDDKNTDNWDSIHILSMIILIEREFKISLPEEQFANMVSFKSIEAIINDCTRCDKGI